MSVSRSTYWALCTVLVALGLLFMQWGKLRPYGVAGASAGAIAGIVLACMSAGRYGPASVWRCLQRLTPEQRRRAAVVAGIAAAATIFVLALALDRPLVLLWHDEHQFHLQSQLIARFRLWLPRHDLVPFFDTFYVLIEPVYAPQSFPGAAMMFVPTVWFHLPTWVMPLLITGVACGLLWWLLSELVDSAAATLGLTVLVADTAFDRVAAMYLAQIPLLTLGLAAITALLIWRKKPTLRVAAIIGASLGWAAITRPLDAACFGVIVAVGMFCPLRQLSLRRIVATCGVVIVSALPFLIIQAVMNLGITGSITKPPFVFYNERDQPALALYQEAPLQRQPLSMVPQKHLFYDQFTLPFILAERDPSVSLLDRWQRRVQAMAGILAPSNLMIPLAFLGLAGLVTRARWLLFAIVPLFAISYQGYPIFLAHYATFALPGIILTYALTPQVAAKLAGARYGAFASRAVAFLLVGMSIGGAVSQCINAPTDSLLVQRRRLDALLEQVHAPAIVLYTAPISLQEMHLEPVYNDSVAWPDDAPIINAHDRGRENIELYRYYAARSPDREVWRLDRRSMRITRLGLVRELASEYPVQ